MTHAFSEKHRQNLQQNVTLGLLLEYTDDFLVPTIAGMIEDSEKRLRTEIGTLRTEMGTLRTDMTKEMGRLNYDLKVYIDTRMGVYTSDIFKRLEKK